MLPVNYQQTIDQIVEKLKNDYQPEKIILFGSCARGDVRKWSDIDMLIVKDTPLKRRIDRAREVSGMFLDRKIPFETIVLRPEEFNAYVRDDHFFIREILKDGRTLYEKR